MEEESWKKAATVSQHHLRTVYKEWKMALDLSKKGSIVLNGKGLRIGAVVAVAKYVVDSTSSICLIILSRFNPLADRSGTRFC